MNELDFSIFVNDGMGTHSGSLTISCVSVPFVAGSDPPLMGGVNTQSSEPAITPIPAVPPTTTATTMTSATTTTRRQPLLPDVNHHYPDVNHHYPTSTTTTRRQPPLPRRQPPLPDVNHHYPDVNHHYPTSTTTTSTSTTTTRRQPPLPGRQPPLPRRQPLLPRRRPLPLPPDVNHHYPDVDHYHYHPDVNHYYHDVDHYHNACKPTAPVLGATVGFAILASQKVTTTGTTAISNGDIGLWTRPVRITRIHGWYNPKFIYPTYNGLSYAHDDMPPLPILRHMLLRLRL